MSASASARAPGSDAVLDVPGEDHGGIGRQLAQMPRQVRIVPLHVEQLVVADPASEAAQVGIRHGPPGAEQPLAVAKQPVQVDALLGDVLTAERSEQLLLAFVEILAVVGCPQRRESGKEVRDQIGEHLVERIGIGPAPGDAELALRVPARQMQQDGQALAERPAVLEQQRGRLQERIHPDVERIPGTLKHVDAAEAIRLAQPLQCHDRAEGATLRHTIEENRFLGLHGARMPFRGHRVAHERTNIEHVRTLQVRYAAADAR